MLMLKVESEEGKYCRLLFCPCMFWWNAYKSEMARYLRHRGKFMFET